MILKNLVRCVFIPAAVSVGIAGCGSDVYFDAPALEAVGIDLNNRQVEEDVPERAGLVLPPSTDKLPVPGSKVTASTSAQDWPEDPDVSKKRKAEAEAAAREEYCKNGNWDDGNIDEFEKNAGDEYRCQSGLVEAITKAVSGGPSDDEY
ncbi:MAG: hypothetical protein KTR19_07615 [Hyphomicrobiales bacterium]|nr:hypothetical protein [Hyphomicrobiales bacterium]